ncbi:MAG: threonine/serine exporter family protein [Vulcanimicrobiaceae bacterium]
MSTILPSYDEDPRAAFIRAMARELHLAGVATDALEQTLDDVAATIGLEAQVLAFPTYLMIAVGPEHDQHLTMLRLPPGSVSLRKISLLNDIYDRLREGKIDYLIATRLLSELDEHWPPIALWLRIPALMMIGIGVAIILGASLHEIIVAGAIGAVTGGLSMFAARYSLMARLFEVAAAFAATLIVAIFSLWYGRTDVYVSIIAGVVVILPGYSLTLALHELANRDLVAGVARLGKVLSTLFALGCGALLGFAVAGPWLATSGAIRPHPVSMSWWLLAVALMASGLCIDLDARRRDIGWVAAACFFAIATSHVIGGLPVHQVAAFLSAFVCGVVANLGARFLRVPQPVMLVPAVIVLVPGSLSYESVLFAFQNHIADALTIGANAASAAIQIVAGLLLSQLLITSSPLRGEQ